MIKHQRLHYRLNMNQKPFLLLLLIILQFACSPKIGPKIHYFKKSGQHFYTSKIYGYLNGKRTLVQIDTYKKQNNSSDDDRYELYESVLFYELWPNDEWKFVSKTGFAKLKNGVYYLDNDSVKVPDNVVYRYYDKNYVEQIEVYKDGKRIKYTQGYPDGHRTMQFLRDKPGVYNWKDGKEYFERPFTPEEWESHRKINENLNKKSATDSTKKN